MLKAHSLALSDGFKATLFAISGNTIIDIYTESKESKAFSTWPEGAGDVNAYRNVSAWKVTSRWPTH